MFHCIQLIHHIGNNHTKWNLIILYSILPVFVCCWTFRLRILCSYRVVTIAVKDCEMHEYSPRKWSFSSERSLSCHACCDRRPRFSQSHWTYRVHKAMFYDSLPLQILRIKFGQDFLSGLIYSFFIPIERRTPGRDRLLRRQRKPTEKLSI